MVHSKKKPFATQDPNKKTLPCKVVAFIKDLKGDAIKNSAWQATERFWSTKKSSVDKDILQKWDVLPDAFKEQAVYFGLLSCVFPNSNFEKMLLKSVQTEASAQICAFALADKCQAPRCKSIHLGFPHLWNKILDETSISKTDLNFLHLNVLANFAVEIQERVLLTFLGLPLKTIGVLQGLIQAELAEVKVKAGQAKTSKKKETPPEEKVEQLSLFSFDKSTNETPATGDFEKPTAMPITSRSEKKVKKVREEKDDPVAEEKFINGLRDDESLSLLEKVLCFIKSLKGSKLKNSAWKAVETFWTVKKEDLNPIVLEQCTRFAEDMEREQLLYFVLLRCVLPECNFEKLLRLTAQKEKKQQMCVFDLAGLCEKGERCNAIHLAHKELWKEVSDKTGFCKEKMPLVQLAQMARSSVAAQERILTTFRDSNACKSPQYFLGLLFAELRNEAPPPKPKPSKPDPSEKVEQLSLFSFSKSSNPVSDDVEMKTPEMRESADISLKRKKGDETENVEKKKKQKKQ